MTQLAIALTYPHPLTTPGGGTKGCLRIAEQMEKLGAEVTLIPVTKDPATNGSVHLPVCAASPSRIHYLLDSLSVKRTIGDILAAKNVHAVLGWDSEVALVGRMLRRSRVTFGMIAASPSYEAWFNRPTAFHTAKRITDYFFRRRPLQSSDLVFALSAFTRNELISAVGVAPEKVVVAYWGVDAILAGIRRSPGKTLSRLIFFGSLAPPKGILDAITALGRIASQGWREWTLKVAGWGDVEVIRRHARDHGVADRITFTGALSQKSLLQELAWAQLAILPSHVESFGLSIAEAQAAGLPVVSYRAGSIPEIVEDGTTGLLAGHGEIDALAAAVVSLMANPARAFAMGEAARERVLRRFTWERTARTMLGAISSVREKRESQRNHAKP